MNDKYGKGGRATGLAKWFALAGIVFIVIGLLLPRIGLSPMMAMLAITLGSLSIIIGAVCGALGLIRSRGTGAGASPNMAWLAIVLGVAVVLNTGMMMGGAGGAPIHDISTDTEDPPEFVEVAKLRSEGDNPAEYSGPETAAMQKEAYPDIETIVLRDPRSFVFETALEVAEDMGWEIVAQDAAAGRIEATATTPFVGFKDDVVIRLRTRNADTVVDVRSKSRFGRGDMGVNAARVREFTQKLVDAANP